MVWIKRWSTSLLGAILAVVAGAAIAAVGPTGSAATQAGAAQATPQTARAVVEGTIRDAHGKEVAGASVALFAVPPYRLERKVKAGHGYPYKLIGHGRTSRHGFYEIVVEGAGLRIARDYSFSKQHMVNLDVGAAYGPLGAEHWFFRQYKLGALANALMQGDIVQELAPQTVNLTLSQPPITASSRQFLRRLLAEHPNPDVPGCLACVLCIDHILMPISMHGNQQKWEPASHEVVVGASYSNMKNVAADFTYGTGQNSQLGVGISYASDPTKPLGLSFTLGGNQSISNTEGVPFTEAHGFDNRDYLTRFIYGIVLSSCTGYSVQPTGYAGGSSHREVASFPEYNNYCYHYEASPKPIQQHKGVSYTFTAGVSISYLLGGLNLTAQTGYDRNAELDYTLPRGGYLCGKTGPPGSAAAGNLLYAGKYTPSKAKHSSHARRRHLAA